MLQEYSLEVILKPGSANIYTNALSQWDELLGEEGVQTFFVMLPDTHHVTIDTDFSAKVWALVDEEELPDWFNQVSEGWKAGQHLYIPLVLRSELMTQMHDCPAGGYFGVNKIHKWILKFYTWPGSCKDVKVFVQRCSVCTQMKHST